MWNKLAPVDEIKMHTIKNKSPNSLSFAHHKHTHAITHLKHTVSARYSVYETEAHQNHQFPPKRIYGFLYTHIYPRWIEFKAPELISISMKCCCWDVASSHSSSGYTENTGGIYTLHRKDHWAIKRLRMRVESWECRVTKHAPFNAVLVVYYYIVNKWDYFSILPI